MPPRSTAGLSVKSRAARNPAAPSGGCHVGTALGRGPKSSSIQSSHHVAPLAQFPVRHIHQKGAAAAAAHYRRRLAHEEAAATAARPPPTWTAAASERGPRSSQKRPPHHPDGGRRAMTGPPAGRRRGEQRSAPATRLLGSASVKWPRRDLTDQALHQIVLQSPRFWPIPTRTTVQNRCTAAIHPADLSTNQKLSGL